MTQSIQENNIIICKNEENHERENICSICLENFDYPKTLTCTHKYCFTCILQWYYIQKTCPECRRCISPVQLQIEQELNTQIASVAPPPTQNIQVQHIQIHNNYNVCISCSRNNRYKIIVSFFIFAFLIFAVCVITTLYYTKVLKI